MRSHLQKQRGGYGPKHHSEETRQKFSERTSGEGNPMYGKHHTDEAKKLIGEANRKYTGRNNRMSKCYKLTSPTGDVNFLWGGELKTFCSNNDLSLSTLKNQIYKDWGIPKKGKTKGWQLEITIGNKEI